MQDRIITKLIYLFLGVLLLFTLILPVDGYTLQVYPIHDGQLSRAPTGYTMTNLTYNNASMKQGTTSALTSATGIIGAYTGAGTTSDNFTQVTRLYYTFDVSQLPLDATVTSAYFRIVPSAKTVTLGSPAIVVTAFTPDNKLAYIAGDYNKTNLIPVSSYLEATAINVGYENFIPLNQGGLDLIRNSIISKYVSLNLATSWDINQSNIPQGVLWGVSRSAIYTTYLSEQTDVINDPYLIITYQFGSATNNIYTNVTMDNENQENFYSFINQYILIVLVLLVFVISFYTEPYLAFIGFIIAFIGLTTTVNFSFEFGTIFVILMCAGFFIGVRGED